MGPHRAVLLALTLVVATAGTCAAQGDERVNLSRFVLGVDAPASPALLPLGVERQVPRGSAPKPLEASAFAGTGAATHGVAIGGAPYSLAGGGMRTLGAYRTSTVAGRLLRVLPTAGLTAALTTHAAPGLVHTAPRPVAVRVTAQWFYTSDR